MPVLLDLAGDFDEHRAGAVDHDVGDVVARQQRLQRAVTEHVVADVVEQFFLLGDRHHDVLDRDDLVDDVADFLARRFAVELGELGEVDRLDQRAEDRRLDLVIIVGPPRLPWRAAAAAWRATIGGEATAGAATSREAAAAPEGSGALTGGLRRPRVAVLRYAYQTRSYSTRAAYFLPAASRSGATGTTPSASWSRRGLSAAARSAGTSRWCDDWRRFPRSSGRYWRPSRTSAARTESIAIGGLSIALANSLALISGRFGMPTWLRQ